MDSALGIAESIAAFIESLDSARVTVIGNCSGAILGLLANELVPSRIARFVLIDPFAFLPWYFKVFVHPTYGRVAYHSTFANPIGRWATNLSLKKKRSADSDLTPVVPARRSRGLAALPGAAGRGPEYRAVPGRHRTGGHRLRRPHLRGRAAVGGDVARAVAARPRARCRRGWSSPD